VDSCGVDSCGLDSCGVDSGMVMEAAPPTWTVVYCNARIARYHFGSAAAR
jgi:hypothetical protein